MALSQRGFLDFPWTFPWTFSFFFSPLLLFGLPFVFYFSLFSFFFRDVAEPAFAISGLLGREERAGFG
jgi:hypothetical protein